MARLPDISEIERGSDKVKVKLRWNEGKSLDGMKVRKNNHGGSYICKCSAGVRPL